MPVLVMCNNPACGELFSVPDKAVGAEIRCPACGQSQTAARAGAPQPDTSGLGTPAAPAPQPDVATAAPVEPAPPKPPRASPPPAPPGEETPPIDIDLGPEETDLRPLLEEAEPPPPPERPQARTDLSSGDSFSLTPVEEPEAGKKPAPPPPGASPPPPQRQPAEGPPIPARRDGRSRPREAPPPQTPPAQTSTLGDLNVDAQLDQWLAEAAVGEDEAEPAGAGQDVLEQRVATTSILVLGLLGMAVGAVVGAVGVEPHRILGAYLGAGAGWVAGFVAAMLLVMLLGNVRCPSCLKACSSAMGVCDACGAPLSNTRPLTTDCLLAGGYARRSAASAVLPVVLLMIASAAVSITYVLWNDEAMDRSGLRPLLLGGSGVLGFFTFACWQQLLLDTAALAMARRDKRPKPRIWSLTTYGNAFKGLIALAVYVLPLVTLPLLPLLLLRMLSPRDRRGLRLLDLPDCVRTVLLHPADFVVLWLAILMWSTAIALAVVVIAFLLQFVPALPDWPAVQVARCLVLTVIFGTVAALGAIVLSRCVGMFGRYIGSDFVAPRPDASGTSLSDLA